MLQRVIKTMHTAIIDRALKPYSRSGSRVGGSADRSRFPIGCPRDARGPAGCSGVQMSTITRSRASDPTPQRDAEARRRPHLVPEMLLVAAVYMAYTLGRFAAAKRPSGAFSHASDVWHVE